MVKVSQSKIKSWRKCKQEYHYKYHENLRRKTPSRPLKFGSIVHELIEAHAEGDDWHEHLDVIAKSQRKLFQKEIEEYGDIIEDIRCIMTEYFDYYDDRDLIYIRRKGKGAEFEFNVEISRDIILTGKIDAIGQTRNKLKWLVEHKTFSRSLNDDHRWRNLQSSAYIRVIEMMGLASIEGTLWDYIYSKSPARPELLKNGTVSKRAIKTLPSRLIEAIEEYGLEPKDYGDLIAMVSEKRDEWFQRIFTPTKKQVVDLMFKDILASAREIAEINSKFKPIRSIDFHCDGCSYEPLCRAVLTGSDVDYVKEHEYYVSDKDHEKERSG